MYIRKKKAKQDGKLEELLKTQELVEALALEQQLDMLESSMAQSLFGFTELARLLDHRRVILRPISDVLEEENIHEIQDLLRVSISFDRLSRCLGLL
jgi:hypothetical protein